MAMRLSRCLRGKEICEGPLADYYTVNVNIICKCVLYSEVKEY